MSARFLIPEGSEKSAPGRVAKATTTRGFASQMNSTPMAAGDSANFSSGMNGQQLKLNPPGGRGVLRLHEVKLFGPDESKPTVNAGKAAPR